MVLIVIIDGDKYMVSIPDQTSMRYETDSRSLGGRWIW